MPLIKGRSKKAFEQNTKEEMGSGKPQKQSLAIAYSIQRKNKKNKMADGGEVSTSNGQSQGKGTYDQAGPAEKNLYDQLHNAFTPKEDKAQPQQQKSRGGMIEESIPQERRPMPDDEHADARMDRKVHNRPNSDIEDARSERMTSIDDARDEEEMRMMKYAKGGSVRQHALDSEDHLESVADMILRKRKMMADGGEVDLEDNAIEHGNELDDLNYEALGKENYSEAEGLRELSSPMDSNEHGHDLDDEDSMDMVDQLRKKIKAKRGM